MAIVEWCPTCGNMMRDNRVLETEREYAKQVALDLLKQGLSADAAAQAAQTLARRLHREYE